MKHLNSLASAILLMTAISGVAFGQSIPINGSGSSGGAITVSDGADVTQGAKADAKSTATDTTPTTAMSVLKQISASVQAPPAQVIAAGSAIVGKVSTVDSGGTDATDTTNHAIKVNVVAGGAGGGAVYGPTAVGSAAANPPVLMAGTANATATGNVQVWKVDSSGYGQVTVTNNGTAIDAAIAGQTPSTIACQRLTSAPAVATTATTGPVNCNEYGGIVVNPYALQDRLVKGTTSAMTGTTSTSLVAAPGAGLKNYITTLSCVNSHATVGTFVTVQDGSGGTAIWTVAAAALFGGTAITFPAPLQQPTANTALYVADVTTGANVICSASGYKAP